MARNVSGVVKNIEWTSEGTAVYTIEDFSPAGYDPNLIGRKVFITEEKHDVSIGRLVVDVEISAKWKDPNV